MAFEVSASPQPSTLRGITKAIRRHFNLVGAIEREALGDFTMELAWLAGAKLHMSNCKLTILTRPSLTEAIQETLNCCPYIDEHISVEPANWKTMILQKSLEPRTFVMGSRQIPALNLEFYSIRAPLVIPEDRRDGLYDQLIESGIAPDRWLASLHCRNNLTFRGPTPDNDLRDVDPQTFSELCDYIVDGLGGQVAWLGHPGAPPAPSRSGVFSLIDAPVMLQNYAIARSRYFVGCDSGPVMTSSAFEVPTLKTNSIYESGGWNSHDIVLTKNVLTADGEVISLAGMDRRIHWMKRAHSLDGITVVDNTIEQIKHCVDLLHQRTATLSGWRELQSQRMVDNPPEAFPMTGIGRIGPCAQIIELAHLLGRPVLKREASEQLRRPQLLQFSSPSLTGPVEP